MNPITIVINVISSSWNISNALNSLPKKLFQKTIFRGSSNSFPSSIDVRLFTDLASSCIASFRTYRSYNLHLSYLVFVIYLSHIQLSTLLCTTSGIITPVLTCVFVLAISYETWDYDDKTWNCKIGWEKWFQSLARNDTSLINLTKAIKELKGKEPFPIMWSDDDKEDILDWLLSEIWLEQSNEPMRWCQLYYVWSWSLRIWPSPSLIGCTWSSICTLSICLKVHLCKTILMSLIRLLWIWKLWI